MNCEKCGSPLEQGSVYCLNCGKVQGEPEKTAPAARTVYTPSAEAPPPPVSQAVQTPPPLIPPPVDGSQGGGFFSTSAGKTLAVVLALLVAAGVAVGVVFLVKGSGGSQVDESTMEIWEEYQDLLEEDGDDLDPISYDVKALREDQADLAESIEAVEDLEKDLKHAETTQGGKDKADELAEALESYRDYLTLLHKYYGDLAAALEGGTLKDQKVADQLTSLLDEAQDLAVETTKLSEAFLKNNDKVKSKKFDPDVLAVAEKLGPGLRDQIALALSAEKQRLEAEKAAAEQAAAEAAAAQAAAEAAAAQAEAEAAAAAARSGRDYSYSFMDNAYHDIFYSTCPYCGSYPTDTVYGNGPEGWGYYCVNCRNLVAY